ncbi:MAG: VanZ family protein [Brachymonas sp.]|nr:VanZ family protein [Brachymonas sp.]
MSRPSPSSAGPSSTRALAPRAAGSPLPVRRRAVLELALIYAGLIVYASLYPFAPWSSNGLPWWGFVAQPWPRYWTRFDFIANLLGYVPLGFLIALAALRSAGQWRRRLSVVWSALLCALLSFSVEVLQNWLPQRVPSNVDWLLNSAGGLLGAVLAWLVVKCGALEAWSRLRRTWFVPDAQENLVLLLLWPWALLYPQPLPFGLGQVQERLENQLAQWLAGTPFVDWLPLRTIEFQPLLQWQITLVVALGLALPCLLAFGAMPAWRKRAALAVLLLGVGVLANALGNALGLGPVHAWAWLWPPVQTGLLAGAALAAVAVGLPRWLCRLLAVTALLVQLYLVNGAAVSAYFGLEEEWLPGRFIRFYGLTQWIGWLWPYATLLYLMAVVGAALRRAWANR